MDDDRLVNATRPAPDTVPALHLLKTGSLVHGNRPAVERGKRPVMLLNALRGRPVKNVVQ